MGKMGDLQVAEEEHYTWQENSCQAIQKQWDMGYLANRPGPFLTKARVKIFKMIKPRLPSLSRSV